MKDKTLKKEDLREFVEYLKGDYEVVGPQRKGNEFVFDYIDDGVKLELDYPTTILPPKKLFFPPKELLYGYEKTNGDITLRDLGERWDRKRVLLGVHPCDLHGLLILDGVFNGELKDPIYLHRRKNTIIICIHCRNPTEYCFCDAMEAGPTVEKGYDLLVTDIGDRFYFQSGSEIGREILGAALFEDATKGDRKKKEAEILRLREELRSGFKIDGLEDRMRAKFWSKLWDTYTEKCVLCGACNFTCPTCYCFNIVDETDFTGKKGRRVRIWDSCHFQNFALIAGRVNFREGRIPRIKLRLYHKFCYSVEQRGVYDCIGCGRCIQFCPAKIDLKEILKEVRRG